MFPAVRLIQQACTDGTQLQLAFSFASTLAHTLRVTFSATIFTKNGVTGALDTAEEFTQLAVPVKNAEPVNGEVLYNVCVVRQKLAHWCHSLVFEVKVKDVEHEKLEVVWHPPPVAEALKWFTTIQGITAAEISNVSLYSKFFFSLWPFFFFAPRPFSHPPCPFRIQD